MLKAGCEIFAHYNTVMNKRLYTCAAQLDETALRLDRGAFLAPFWERSITF